MKQIVSKMFEKVGDVFKFKDSKMSKKQMKLIIPAAICLFVFVVALSGKVLLSSLTSSVYNIGDLNNLDNVNVGDTINYSINGYSNWKVLSVDKNNGTVEVTSETNTKDLTIQPYQSVEEYNQLFQTEANKFLDNNYVVSARTINKADALTFNDESGEEYWLANVNENTLMTNKTGEDGSSAIVTKKQVDPKEIYIIPSVGFNNISGWEVGSVNEYSFGGVNRWIFTGQTIPNAGGNESDITIKEYIPEFPVKLQVNSVDDIPNVVNNYLSSLLPLAVNAPEISYFSVKSLNNDILLLYESKNTFDNLDLKMFFASGYAEYYNTSRGSRIEPYTYMYEASIDVSDEKYNIKKVYKGVPWLSGSGLSYVDTSELNRTTVSNMNTTPLSKDVATFYEPKSLTFGYRPVLTLNISGDSGNSNTNDLNNSQLKLGDYVSYEANDYKNWRVLSINRENGTVDIVSGGIVKNLSLYGKDDYDNYEDILQREVDSYKNGNNAISARAIQESDIDLLGKINDNVGGLYWYNKKTQRRLDDHWDLQISNINSELSYNVGILYNDGNTINPYMARLYSQVGNLTDKEKVEQYLGAGDLGYIAGLRPVITLKADAVKILPNEDIDDIKNQTNRYNQSYISAQKSANRGSKISVIGNSGGIGSDYYDSDDLFNNNVGTNLQNVVLDIGKSNSVLKIIFIIAFIYRFILVAACTYVGYYLIKRRYI